MDLTVKLRRRGSSAAIISRGLDFVPPGWERELYSRQQVGWQNHHKLPQADIDRTMPTARREAISFLLFFIVQILLQSQRFET